MGNTKLKGCRSLDEINTEYSQVCGFAGDLLHKKSLIESDLFKIQARMNELDLEAGHARKQLKEQKLEAVPTENSDSVSRFEKGQTFDINPDGFISSIEGEATT